MIQQEQLALVDLARTMQGIYIFGIKLLEAQCGDAETTSPRAPAGQSVSRFLKVMPQRYSHLPPKVKRVEELVKVVENHLTCQLGCKKKDMVGKTGFHRLLTAVLKAIDGSDNMHRLTAVQSAIQNAQLNTTAWRDAARHALNQRAAGHPWPMAGV